MTIGNLGKYRLEQHLGKGAFGDVYLAQDLALNAVKAIKVLSTPDASTIKKNLEEAQLLHKCMHKNIVQINEANVYAVESTQYIVIDMEYLPLGSFEDAINKGSVSLHDAVRYMIDCLFALEHAHFNGVIHRDIKPANIMLCEYGAKLSDFGLATVLGIDFAGSPQGYTTHLAPEYFHTNATTYLTDIFAVGITLYRACNYIKNWDDCLKRLSNPMLSIQNGSLISDLGYSGFIPLKLKKVINKACHPNPVQRYQTASEFRRALEKLTPSINWLPLSVMKFEGHCIKSGAIHSVEVLPQSKQYQVDIKKNNRKDRAACMQFNTEIEAFKYMNKYVSTTLY